MSEIARGAGELAGNVSEISTSTEATAIGTRTTQESASALSATAAEVDRLIRRFRLDRPTSAVQPRGPADQPAGSAAPSGRSGWREWCPLSGG